MKDDRKSSQNHNRGCLACGKAGQPPDLEEIRPRTQARSCALFTGAGWAREILTC